MGTRIKQGKQVQADPVFCFGGFYKSSCVRILLRCFRYSDQVLMVLDTYLLLLCLQYEAHGSSSSAPPVRHDVEAVKKKLHTANAAAALSAFIQSVKGQGAMFEDMTLSLRLQEMIRSLVHEPRHTATTGNDASSPAGNATGSGSGNVAGGGSGGHGNQDVDMLAAEGSNQPDVDEVDPEVEQNVLAAVQTDAMASYDLDVEEEGVLIDVYMAMCATALARASA